MRSPAIRLFALSFVALFLELMVIRWVPSEVRLVAYYANLLLISSFLGLGIGAIVAGRDWNLFRWFAPLLALYVVVLMVVGRIGLPPTEGEMRFYQVTAAKALSFAMLGLAFVLNAAVFVPLGEEIGTQFLRVPPLRAYVWDLLGSLGGTLAFGLFSFLHFTPLGGIVLVLALAWLLGNSRPRWRMLPWHAVTLLALAWSMQRETTWWSPYYFITVREEHIKLERQPDGRTAIAEYFSQRVDSPAPNLRTMVDPPQYSVRVNQDFYQAHGTLDARRYSPGGVPLQMIAPNFVQYGLPYRLVPQPGRVLILGAGGGMDVEMALLNGAQRVDAVEIDPVIARLSNRFSAAAPYTNPKVVLHIDDARAFLQRNREQFDLVAFGHLDSQALFSYGASLRLDGYTYTVEGLRAAFARVAPGGAMVVSFVVTHEWMAQKLAQMVETATGAPPIVYMRGGHMAIIAPHGTLATPVPEKIEDWTRVRAAKAAIALATDDWPYLYLEKRKIPTDYVIVIGLLLVLSVGALLALRGRAFGSGDAQLLFLGWGFLLLQTKSIGDCSLYFGTTWLVTMLVITGVLLMVLLANWVALRFVRAFRLGLYVPLFCSLLLLLLVPREIILGQGIVLRIAWTLLIVPLPIFFAGLIFSTTFRESRSPALALGANLIGATIGGFSEYLGMWVGSHALSFLVVAAYAASLLCCLRSRRAAPAGALPSAPAMAAPLLSK